MTDENTTAVVQEYLDALAGESPAEPIIRALLERAVRRLHMLGTSLLRHSYPRLERPPVNLQPDELLSGVVERLLKAMRETRPPTVRQFFGLANQHIRWELNDLARRLDEQPPPAPLTGDRIPSPTSSGSGLSANARRMLEAIEALLEDEREVFSLVRIQGMSQTEVANLLGVAVKTVQRRLSRSLIQLTEALADLQ